MYCTMVKERSPDRRRELGDFVRALREKLKPSELGLPAGSRRRTPGLRREEMAQLCGLSVTWYTWLEQGRDMSLSAAALARLATALRLGRAERAYLFELADRRDPGHGGVDTDVVPPAVLASVELIAAPAYVLDRSWTARSWNVHAEQLFSGWLDAPDDRNLLRFIFLAPPARSLICDYDERARRVVAEFRADVSAHLDDPAIRLLVEDLGRQSALFRRFWHEHWVMGREGGERTFRHPERGFLRYEQVTFALAGRQDLKLTMLTPAAG
ncbi:transcriptional regulator [Mesorhizobium sp. L-8-3]|nr:transcriptional regulator [Mesorhizobium sp. L-8-3]